MAEEEKMKNFIKEQGVAYGYCLSDESMFFDPEPDQESCMEKAMSFCKKLRQDVSLLIMEGNGFTLECNVFGVMKYNHGNVLYDELVPFWK